MQKKSLKYLFIVQGEGRGHMTQAISLSETLRASGHQVVSVLVGKSERREIPEFFHNRIGTQVQTFESPNFVMDANNKSIKLLPTIFYNLQKSGFFLKNLKIIHEHVTTTKPDIIINFYDLLGGLYNAIYKPTSRFICIGHQYLLLHPGFKFPRKRMVEKLLVQWNTHLTSLWAEKRLALSFTEMQNEERHNILVVPPLLRKEVLQLIPESQPYFLVYLLNSGYSEDIIKWHEKNPSVKLHCFWDRKDIGEEYRISENLIFHKINDKKFLELMKGCSGFVSTAGFESICEAMYLGKPVMMVPTQGHFEQECNALDASSARAGISNSRFDLSNLLDYLPKHLGINQEYKAWVKKANSLFLKELDAA